MKHQTKIKAIIMIILFSINNLSCQNKNQNTTTKMENKIIKTDEEWKKQLTEEQYYVLREKGTERPFTSSLNNFYEEGTYVCAGCNTELFTSTQKFDGHCGWPSFDGELGGGDRIKKIKDISHGMIRTEIVCANCNGHLGHIFDDGPTASGLRYCVNGLSLGFKKK
jgi:peptide-methionine (R)-S-oxide reductase